jgi:YVTN family beta-propeller protein
MRRPFIGLAASLIVSFLIVAGLAPDAFSQQVIATIAVGNSPIYLAADQKRNRIYVSDQGDDTVSVIDGLTNTVMAVVRVGGYPNGIAVNPKTNTIYVANLRSGSLSIIDGSSFTASTLRLGFHPAKVAINAATNKVYVTLEDQNGALAVIDGKNRKLIASIPLPPYPLSVAVDSPSNQIYVADFLCGCGQVTVVDGSTDTIINNIALPGASMVGGVALAPRTEFGYATDENNGLYVIDLASGTILGEISGLSYPNEVAAIPGTSFAVEPDTGSDRAIFIGARNLVIEKRVRVGKFPTGVAVNAATKRVYVANRESNTVSVIQLPERW